MDTEYLKNNIGHPLAAGLAHVIRLQPSDQIGALAQFLAKYADDIEQAEKSAAQMQQFMVLEETEFSAAVALREARARADEQTVVSAALAAAKHVETITALKMQVS